MRTNFEFKGNVYEINFTDKYITIYDSCLVEKDDIRGFVRKLKNDFPNENVLKNRSDGSIVREWESHNLLYDLNFKRENTRHVDIEDNQSSLLSFLYFVVSLFY